MTVLAPSSQVPLRYRLFPVVLCAGWVVMYFNLMSAPLDHLWRPLLLATAGASVLTALLILVTRGRRPVFFVAGGALVVAAAGAWLYVGVLIAIAAWRYGTDWLRRRAGRPGIGEPPAVHVSRLATTLGVAVLAVSLGRGLVIAPTPLAPAPAAPPDATLPNMYVLVLDGYPRDDSLEKLFSIETAEFRRQLEERGFDVATSSRSNYSKTQLTFVSMLNGRYVTDLPSLRGPSGDGSEDRRRVARALHGPSAVLDAVAGRGYEIVSVASSFGEVRVGYAHTIIESNAMTQFEELLFRTSAMALVTRVAGSEFAMDQHRRAVEAAFEAIDATAKGGERSSFTFAHIMAPHVPFAFAADGSEVPAAPCYPQCGLWDAAREQLGYSADEYAALMAGQVAWLNRQILETVDRIVASDEDAVIILTSDHGTRWDKGDPGEYFATFAATRTPGHPDLIRDDVHAVNLLTTVLNAYLETSFETLPYRAWLLSDTVLTLVPFDPRGAR